MDVLFVPDTTVECNLLLGHIRPNCVPVPTKGMSEWLRSNRLAPLEAFHGSFRAGGAKFVAEVCDDLLASWVVGKHFLKQVTRNCANETINYSDNTVTGQGAEVI